MLVQTLQRGLTFLLLASVSCITANADTTSDALAQIPACGLECIVQNLPAIGCQLLDTECQCTSKNATKILQPCLKSKCTYEETFTILRAQATLCNRPHDAKSNAVRVVAWVSGIVPIIVIIMRFASRHLGGNKFWWDDWLHLASVILVIPMTVALLMNVEAGIGHHIWDLTYPRVMDIGRWTYIATLFWGFELLLLKYSILCLYLRIFPNVWLKRAIYAFMAFTAAFTLPLLGLAAFQCIPIDAIWDLRKQPTAKCVNWIVVLNLTVVYEVIAEIVLFSLPIPIVLKLQMKTAKKIQLMCFFGLGVCVIAVSIVRIPFLPGVVDTTDPTYTVTPTSITGFVSSPVAHIAAAIPTIKALFRFCYNGFKINSKASSSYAKESSHGSSGKRSYKSLGKKGSSQLSKGSSRNPADPYGLMSLGDIEDNGALIELHPVQAATAQDTKSSEEIGGKRMTVVRESPTQDLDDSSNKSILQKDPHP